jgi:SARP family transcriptional regulator, regulator of embCAB operon
LRYEVLGPLRVVGPSGPRYLSARKQELLLAALLARSGQVVTMEQLSTELWSGRAPCRATSSLHVYVSQVRKFLNQPRQTANPIVTLTPGYLIDIGSDQFDALQFRQGFEKGLTQALIGEHDKAASSFEGALGLWRGPVLDDMRDGPIVNEFAAAQEELRVECSEMLVEAYLRLGRYRDMIRHLRRLIAENPLREAFYQYLMLALYRTDRRAEALEIYHVARRRLRDDLGLDPCRSLRELQYIIQVDNGAEHAMLVTEGALGRRS